MRRKIYNINVRDYVNAISNKGEKDFCKKYELSPEQFQKLQGKIEKEQFIWG